MCSSQLYLSAWQHAGRQTPSPTTSETADALKLLVENWTSDEFVGFVKECEDAVEGLELKEGSETWNRCEEVSWSW